MKRFFNDESIKILLSAEHIQSFTSDEVRLIYQHENYEKCKSEEQQQKEEELLKLDRASQAISDFLKTSS